MQALRVTAMSLKESDIADPSFIDELEHSGFIDRLYAADTKYWHKADIPGAPHMSAFGGKADIVSASQNVCH
jgi:hypothetical protein